MKSLVLFVLIALYPNYIYTEITSKPPTEYLLRLGKWEKNTISPGDEHKYSFQSSKSEIFTFEVAGCSNTSSMELILKTQPDDIVQIRRNTYKNGRIYLEVKTPGAFNIYIKDITINVNESQSLRGTTITKTNSSCYLFRGLHFHTQNEIPSDIKISSSALEIEQIFDGSIFAKWKPPSIGLNHKLGNLSYSVYVKYHTDDGLANICRVQTDQLIKLKGEGLLENEYNFKIDKWRKYINIYI